MAERHVVFFVNGPARLLMTCVIADEKFADARKSLILLDQFGYDYEKLLPFVRENFDQVLVAREKAHQYSHINQFRNVYFNRYPALDCALHPHSTLVQFGLRSPIHKHLIRRAKSIGARVEIYAEGVANDRYFLPKRNESLLATVTRRVFRRAFDLQHDYDIFYLLDPDIYSETPYRAKLAQMFDLYGSDAFRHYSALMTSDIDLSQVEGYDTVLLGQPIQHLVSPDEVRTQEARILINIVGNRRVLILPHPAEMSDGGLDKYRVLPNAEIFSTGVPSELLLMGLRPTSTITYASTAAVNYAMMNPASENFFYPVHRSRLSILQRFQQSLPNMIVSGEYANYDYPGD